MRLSLFLRNKSLTLFITAALTLLSSGPAFAVEEFFQGTSILARGPITGRAAGLAFAKEKMSFSAAASSLNQTLYETNRSTFQNTETPLTIQPLNVTTGSGEGWGGWAFQVASGNYDYRSSSKDVVGT